MKTFGQFLAEEREKKGWSRHDLAAKIKVAESTLGNIENGFRRLADLATWERLSEIMGWTVERRREILREYPMGDKR